MKHTLVTFLGKGRENPQTGYRKAQYRFPDESAPRPETAFSDWFSRIIWIPILWVF